MKLESNTNNNKCCKKYLSRSDIKLYFSIGISAIVSFYFLFPKFEHPSLHEILKYTDVLIFIVALITLWVTWLIKQEAVEISDGIRSSTAVDNYVKVVVDNYSHAIEEWSHGIDDEESAKSNSNKLVIKTLGVVNRCFSDPKNMYEFFKNYYMPGKSGEKILDLTGMKMHIDELNDNSQVVEEFSKRVKCMLSSQCD